MTANSRFSLSRSTLLRASLVAAASAAVLGVGLTTAQADTLANVSIVERASGRVLPVYRHGGELWVAGRPGANYSVRVRNNEGRRILAVVSVDGVNAISGKTAVARPDDGYVLDAADSYDVRGWRKSNDNIAAFYFSESDMSYAARTGRPQDVGVIGVALFREKQVEVVYEAPAYRSRSQDSKAMAESAAPVAEDSIAPAPSAASRNSRMAEKRAPAATPSLGTGHGAVERSHVGTTEFESETTRPAQVVRIRYDSYANLVAKGVIREPRPRPAPRAPRAFPGDDGFVPDPPRN